MAGIPKRLFVPKDKRSWNVSWPQYKPIPFQIDFQGKEWADPDQGEFKWNQLDGAVDRRSHAGLYQVKDGFPLNPLGRTGVTRRGKLGRWGPNHAADPIVTRWKRNEKKEVMKESGRAILQFVAIRRKDTKEWALPGGMVDPGEEVSATVKREFLEEALNSLEASPQKREELSARLSQLFSSGAEIFRGCVDDPRNTDNAWMETVVFHFHDESGETMGSIDLSAGDDAVGVQWTDLVSGLKLYANHLSFIELARGKIN